MTRINTIRNILILVFILTGQTNCSHENPVVENPSVRETVEIVSPSISAEYNTLPLIFRIRNADGKIDVQKTGDFMITGNFGAPTTRTISIKRGVGSITTQIDAARNTEISLEGFGGAKRIEIVEITSEKTYHGVLDQEEIIWDASSIRRVTADLSISANTRLIIEKGARVVLDPEVNFVVEGALEIRGDLENPVVFISQNMEKPWGGLEIHNQTAKIFYCFFVNGGGDPGRVFGHSNSQPVLYAEDAEVEINNGYFIDNPGKALGTRRSRITLKNSVISRCDTGGEFANSLAIIENTYVLDIPNNDGIFVDDDNDGFYFADVPAFSDEPSRVENCVIFTGKDDAIDHNGARLEVSGSWLEGFLHEGVAGSNRNWVKVYNSVIKNCEQGAEAGFGEATVIVDHCVIIENDVGLRLGDSYSHRGSFGKLLATNTILFENADNIRNFDLFIQAARDSALDIRYSMTNDADYDHWPFCFTGTPLFDENYFLLETSPGAGKSSTGGDVGLVKR